MTGSSLLLSIDKHTQKNQDKISFRYIFHIKPYCMDFFTTKHTELSEFHFFIFSLFCLFFFADNRRPPPIIADHPKMYMKIRVLLSFPLLSLFSSGFFCYLYFFRIFYI
jgi:hypothetical protein